MPDIRVLLNIANEGKVDLGWLLLGGPLPEDVRDSRPLSFQVDTESTRSVTPNESDYISVPLTEGEIAAGSPRIGEDDVIDYFLIHVRAIKREGLSRNLVACQVEGDSMSPHIVSGDIVIIDRDTDRNRADEGKVYAVFDGAGVTVKMLQRDGHDLYLVPLNHHEKVMRVDLREVECPIVGQVVAAWRNFQNGID